MKRQKEERPKLPRTLVVGVDDSGSSDHAAAAGLGLAQELGAGVQFVNAVAIPSALRLGMDVVSSGAFTREVLGEASERVEEHFRSVGSARAPRRPRSSRSRAAAAVTTAPAAEVRVQTVLGRPAKVLVQHVRRNKDSWLILGRATRRQALDFGSTLRGVLAKSAVPVWIQPRAPRRVRRILAPVDLSPVSLEALALACAIGRRLGARVVALHSFYLGFRIPTGRKAFGAGMRARVEEVRRSERTAFEREMRGFDWNGVEHATEFLAGEPSETILRRGRGFDLVVLGTHGRTALSSFVLGGTALAVIGRSETAVLAVPRRPRRLRT